MKNKIWRSWDGKVVNRWAGLDGGEGWSIGLKGGREGEGRGGEWSGGGGVEGDFRGRV